MNQNKASFLRSIDVFTYRRLRRTIGYLGVFLPIALVLLSAIEFFETRVQPSISHYYYTNLREVFTGTVCAVGLFLIRYKGHGNTSIWKNDQLLTNIAGIAALGLVLIPVNPEPEHEKIYTFIPYDWSWLGWIHYGFAAVLFCTFSLLAINVFTIGQNQSGDIPYSTINENNIYRFCGVTLIILMVLIPLSETFRVFKYSTLVLEALILLFFGIAWLIKGRALGDEGKIGEKVYRERNSINTEFSGETISEKI